MAEQYPDPDERFRVVGNLVLPIYSCELLPSEPIFRSGDSRAFAQTWQDMLRLQAEGIFPAACKRIESPVSMLHGAVDPHPGRMIYSNLHACLPQLEYHEWAECGHYPWLERAAQTEFFQVLRNWLSRHLTA